VAKKISNVSPPKKYFSILPLYEFHVISQNAYQIKQGQRKAWRIPLPKNLTR
jgi:hypothetical protein